MSSYNQTIGTAVAVQQKPYVHGHNQEPKSGRRGKSRSVNRVHTGVVSVFGLADGGISAGEGQLVADVAARWQDAARVLAEDGVIVPYTEHAQNVSRDREMEWKYYKHTQGAHNALVEKGRGEKENHTERKRDYKRKEKRV